MTDEYSVPSPDPVSVPDSPASEPSSSFGNPVEIENNPTVTEKRHVVLDQLAKTEDISNYAAERRDEEDVMFRGKDIPEDRKSAWYRRASKALNDAQMEAVGIKSNGLPSQEIPDYIPPNARSDDFYPEQFDPHYQKKEGAAAEINAWKSDAVFVDSGRGEGVIDRLRQVGSSVIEVNFGGKPLNDRYVNKRTEMYDELAKWLKAGGCLPNDSALKTDLCAPTYSFNSAGKMVLESKDDIKKRGIRSTDVADSLALTFAMPVAPKRTSISHRSRHDNGDGYSPFSELYERAGKQLGWDNRGRWN